MSTASIWSIHCRALRLLGLALAPFLVACAPRLPWRSGAIGAPAAPLGDQMPTVGATCAYEIQRVPSRWGGPIEYQFDWGDGNVSPWSPAPEASHAWAAAGKTTVTVTARRAHRPEVSARSAGYVLFVRPDDQLTPGIDVSHHQNDKNGGVIDWARVAAAGKRFAFIKATDGYTKGKGCPNGTDPKFQLNMEGALEAGLRVGGYHFARPCLHADATVEARQFVTVAGKYIAPGNLPPVLDIEDLPGKELGVKNPPQWDKASVSRWIRDWCNEVERLTGVAPILYLNRSTANSYLEPDLARQPLWIATNSGDPLKTPGSLGPWARHDFLQYDWKGAIPGIKGAIDFDVFDGDLEALERLVIQEQEQPVEAPPCAP